MKQKTAGLERFILVVAVVVALFTLSVLIWGLTHDEPSKWQIHNRIVAGDMPLDRIVHVEIMATEFKEE